MVGLVEEEEVEVACVEAVDNMVLLPEVFPVVVVAVDGTGGGGSPASCGVGVAADILLLPVLFPRVQISFSSLSQKENRQVQELDTIREALKTCKMNGYKFQEPTPSDKNVRVNTSLYEYNAIYTYS
jgi:hypothetical protein